MIRSFRCQETEAIHEGYGSRRFRGIEEQARKRLRWLHAATSLTDLAAIRGNRLEALSGDGVGQHSFGLMTAGASAFPGATGAHTMSRSRIIAEEGEDHGTET
jgi:proteic killer suppression protein